MRQHMNKMISLSVLALAAFGLARPALAAEPGAVENAVRMIGRVSDAIDLARSDVAAAAAEAVEIGIEIERLDVSFDDKHEASQVSKKLASLTLRLGVAEEALDMAISNLHYLENTIKWLAKIAHDLDSVRVWNALDDARAKLDDAFVEAEDARGVFEKAHRAIERLEARLELIGGIGG